MKSSGKEDKQCTATPLDIQPDQNLEKERMAEQKDKV